jgi:hypothetical protein
MSDAATAAETTRVFIRVPCNPPAQGVKRMRRQKGEAKATAQQRRGATVSNNALARVRRLPDCRACESGRKSHVT